MGPTQANVSSAGVAHTQWVGFRHLHLALRLSSLPAPCAVHRLLCLLIPTVVFTYVRIPPGNGLKPTAGGMLVPVAFVAQAVSMWTLSLVSLLLGAWHLEPAAALLAWACCWSACIKPVHVYCSRRPPSSIFNSCKLVAEWCVWRRRVCGWICAHTSPCSCCWRRACC